MGAARGADASGPAPGPNCLIVHHNSFGMRNDSLVLGQAIRARLPGAEVFTWEIPKPTTRGADGDRMAEVPPEIAPLLPFDVVFFMEHVRPIDRLWDGRFARRRVFVPNFEWILPLDEETLVERGVDAILFKNTFSAGIAAGLEFMRAVPRSRTIGWTSPDILRGRTPQPPPSFDRALHVKGKSRQKQTSLVLKTWHERPHFPHLSALCTAEDGLRFPAPAAIGGNLRVYFGEVDDAELRGLQRSSGIHVFPSAAEGFGHALNEARAAGAILVTTDAPPMHDLVEDGVTGILIRTREENRFRFHRSIGVKVLEEDLAAAVERVLAMGEEQRLQMGRAARAAFLADREAFHSAVAEVVAELR